MILFIHSQSPEQWVGMQSKKNRSQSSENKWAQCFFHLVLNLELIAECYRFPLRAATHSSSSHLWSSPSLMGTSSRTARECQMRWEHKQMQWHYHVVFMQWFQLGLLYTHVISWVAEAIWGLRSVKRTTFCVSTYELALPLHSCLLCSCTCLWILPWLAASWPKSLFAGTSVCLHWYWGCQEQLHQIMSNLVASPRMSLLSPRCVKLLEVCHFFLLSFIQHVSALFGVELHNKFSYAWSPCVPLFPLRAIILCANTEDVEPVSGVSGPKGSKRCCH